MPHRLWHSVPVCQFDLELFKAEADVDDQNYNQSHDNNHYHDDDDADMFPAERSGNHFLRRHSYCQRLPDTGLYS